MFLFGILNSSKKKNEKNRLEYYDRDTSGRLVFVRCLEEFEDTKKDISKLTDLWLVKVLHTSVEKICKSALWKGTNLIPVAFCALESNFLLLLVLNYELFIL